MPRIEDCIDKIGQAKYVSKYDLLKGYWQVPLSERAMEISAFVTPDNLYQCKVMPFGMRNAPGTFQRLMNKVTASLKSCAVYIDDVVVFSDSFEDHVNDIRSLFDLLLSAKLTVNLLKSDLCQAQVVYLGHVVGQGVIKPVNAKIQNILNFHTPSNKKYLMKVLGMAGFYHKFCPNFSDVVVPLTDLLGKNVKFDWTSKCQMAFDNLKAILTNSPVLMAPDFNRAFTLAVYASDVGVGGVLLQSKDGVDHPVCYFSRKLDKHQRRYSTIEKEALALLLSIKHFEVYIHPGHTLKVFTDHNPLTFLTKMRNHNRRLTGWFLTLQEYNLEIHHISGKDNLLADGLSRY